MTIPTELSQEARSLLRDALEVDGPTSADARRSAAGLAAAVGLSLSAAASTDGGLVTHSGLQAVSVQIAAWTKPIAIVAFSAAAWTASDLRLDSSNVERDQGRCGVDEECRSPAIEAPGLGAPVAKSATSDERLANSAPSASANSAPSARAISAPSARANSALRARSFAAPVMEEPPARPQLAAEVALLDEARQALARGDGAAALVKLDVYEAEFSRGSLHSTAELLRARTWCALGRTEEARSLAKRLSERAPQTLSGVAASSVCPPAKESKP